jgi:hypothetical protein
MDVLYHRFFRGGDDLNLIAAFVYFLDDISVRGKYTTDDDDGIEAIVLTQEERIKLFIDGGIHGCWHYCYPKDIGDQLDFQDKLRDEAARDGFEIEFVILSGPDYLGRVGDDRFFRSSTIIVGTGHSERTIFRAETETGLRRLHNYSDWRILPLTRVAIQAFGAEGRLHWLLQKLEMMFPDAAVDLTYDKEAPWELEDAVKFRLRKGIWRLGQVRECHHLTGPPEHWIHFVPTRFFGMEGKTGFLGHPELETQLSSTRIRDILARVEDSKEMVRALSGVALSPNLLLFAYVRRHQEKAAQKAARRKYRKMKKAKARMVMRASN